MGVAVREAGWEPVSVLWCTTAIERSSCSSSRDPDALPKGSLLKFSSVSSHLPNQLKTTVVMEAISNHAEEEVRRVVTFPFGFFVELLVHEPPRDPWAMRFHHTS